MFKNRFGQVRSGWLIALAFLITFIGQLIVARLGIRLGLASGMSENEINMALETGDMSPMLLVLIHGLGTLGSIVATLIVFRIINKKDINKLQIQGPLLNMLYGLLLGAGSMTIIFFLLLMTNQITLMNTLSTPQFSHYTLAFLVFFILVGFYEEIFFRGYVMRTMADRHNKRWMIYLISALVFGLVHILNPNVNIIGMINIILVGLLFAYMFETTKSLMLPIGFHITWNFFQGPVYGFAVSGLPPHSLYSIDIADGSDLITGGTFGVEGGLMATFLIIITFFFTSIYAKKRPKDRSRLFAN